MYNSKEKDELFIRKARSGDAEAFGALVRRYQEGVFHLASNLVGSKEEAEDITAESFVRAFRNLKRFRNESCFKTWLWKIVINMSRSHLRRRYLQRKLFFWRRPVSFSDGREPGPESDWADRSGNGDPERRSENGNIRFTVQEARKKLSVREREVFTFKYDENFRIAEIGALLSLSPNTVKVLLFRATRKIAAALKDYRK